ncbi:MAG: hypothetical protein IT428_01185 [Planctomycetaceae bacterium]|nr:hypothetical protein [Planctomycetaceae bacterium]
MSSVPSSPPWADAFQWRTALTALATVATGIAWMAASGLARRESVAWLGEWPDLVLVQVACAWPLASVIHRLVPSGLGGVAIALACGGIAAGLAGGTAPTFVSGMCQRGLAAAFALVAARVLVSVWTSPIEVSGRPITGTRLAIASVLCLLLPGLYAWHQAERELARMGTLIGRQRPAAALRSTLRAQRLHPEATWNGQPLAAVAKELFSQIEEIREQLAWSTSETPAAQPLERCRLLAAVDRGDDAIAEARSLADDPEVAVSANLLLASLFEERSAWKSCRDSYATALRHMNDRPHRQDPRRTEALQGLGFAEQNLGNHLAAEAAYLESLKSPDGASAHALLSSLYADAQNIAAARAHAAFAAQSDPGQLAAQERLEARASRDRFCRPQPVSMATPRAME